MLTGFEVYRIYIGIKLHFNNRKYDYFKYGPRNVKRSSYDKRNDKAFFEKLAKQPKSKIIAMFVANFVANENLWIGNLVLNNECYDAFIAWRKRMNSYTEFVSNEMRMIQEFLESRNLEFDDLFRIEDNKQPIIFRLLIQDYISLETYITMDRILQFHKIFQKKFSEDFVFNRWDLKIIKYSSFITFDEKKFMQIMQNIFVKNV